MQVKMARLQVNGAPQPLPFATGQHMPPLSPQVWQVLLFKLQILNGAVQVRLPAVPQHGSPILPQAPAAQPPLLHIPFEPLQSLPLATQTPPFALSQQPPFRHELLSQQG